MEVEGVPAGKRGLALSANGSQRRSQSFTVARMSDRTLSVRLKPEAYGEVERKARAEGRTLAGYARTRLLEDDLSVWIQEVNERLKNLEDLLRRSE